jgi:hypothetical protein
MRGLDPRIHQENKSRFSMMDCRVKPGNDDGWVARERIVRLIAVPLPKFSRVPLDGAPVCPYPRPWATPPQRGACYLEG